MKFEDTSLSGVTLIQPRIFEDDRGFFLETWHKRKFMANGLNLDFVQDNHSKSSKNTLRGLHYQSENPQGKLVRVISGTIFDVAVDIRKSSLNYGHWTGEILSSSNKKMLWIPEGFAHGFLVISEQAEVVYKCTNFYYPEFEQSIRWDDPEINIDWPLSNEITEPFLSEKDANAHFLKDAVLFP